MIPAKLNAIARGDMSGLVLHPIFIHVAHLIGCLFYHHTSEESSEQLYAVHLHHVLDVLSSLPMASALEQLQVYTLIGTFFYLRHQLHDGWSMIHKANEIVAQYGLHVPFPSAEAVAIFMERDGPYVHLQATDEADELRSFLCHLSFIDKGSEIMISMPVGLVPWLEEELTTITVSVS